MHEHSSHHLIPKLHVDLHNTTSKNPINVSWFSNVPWHDNPWQLHAIKRILKVQTSNSSLYNVLCPNKSFFVNRILLA